MVDQFNNKFPIFYGIRTFITVRFDIFTVAMMMYFNPEDKASNFPRNTGIYRRVYVAPKPQKKIFNTVFKRPCRCSKTNADPSLTSDFFRTHHIILTSTSRSSKCSLSLMFSEVIFMYNFSTITHVFSLLKHALNLKLENQNNYKFYFYLSGAPQNKFTF